MPSDHASIAAAQTAGFIVQQKDNGAGKTPRFITVIEKHITGDTDSGHVVRGDGESQVSQAAADTQALAAINGWRKHRYGTDGTNVNKGSGSGNALTTDAK